MKLVHLLAIPLSICKPRACSGSSLVGMTRMRCPKLPPFGANFMFATCFDLFMFCCYSGNSGQGVLWPCVSRHNGKA